MPRPESKRINRDQYDGVLFDLDGVITNTATLHATCWKQMFDEYLRERAEQKGEAFRPFDLATDYRFYVDGKPRFDGVRDFLRSRGIQLPEGNPGNPADVETVHGLGNRRFTLNSWPSWKRCRRSATDISACAGARKKAAPTPRMALSSMDSTKHARSSMAKNGWHLDDAYLW